MSNVLQRERFFRRLNWILIPVYIVLAVYAMWSGVSVNDSYPVMQGGLALVLLAAPPLLSLALHFPIPQDCRLLYYSFILCTVVIGSALYGYSKIPYWDKIFHFLSGLLLSAVGLAVWQLFFSELGGETKLRQRFIVWFLFLWNMTIAVLWEFYEYALLIFLGIDAVNNSTTGVHDTLQDMFVCMLGGLLFLYFLRNYFQKQRPFFLLKTCFHLFEILKKPMEL